MLELRYGNDENQGYLRRTRLCLLELCDVGVNEDNLSPLLANALASVLRPIVREAVREALEQNGKAPQLLTPEELAERLKVPLSWVYEQSRQGNIPTHRLGSSKYPLSGSLVNEPCNGYLFTIFTGMILMPRLRTNSMTGSAW